MKNTPIQSDIILIGAGIMSATLGTFLKQLQPDYTIQILERLDGAAAESSDAWNNAGTGHSAFCELNYTPEKPDGSIDISKAIQVAESFDLSRQFWSYLTEKKILTPPQSFIRSIPHMSFVSGKDDVGYLKKRYEAMQTCPLFKGMQYTDDYKTLTEWIPLMMEGRKDKDAHAATRMDAGTDVNFGSLTRCMLNQLKNMNGVQLHFNQQVQHLHRTKNGWKIITKDEKTAKKQTYITKFIFIGAGGGSLPLLLKSGIPEGKSFGGFPVSGQWLKCKNQEVINKHDAKVYGKPSLGAPPMSVPHLDTRMISDKKELLFGPYAGFSTKFLKKGSFFDLLLSIRLSNVLPMLAAGFHNIPLTKYLIDQVRQSPEDRLNALKEFVPTAKMEDWELVIAGQRVQVIKKDEEEGGILEFGTEVVNAGDGSLAALLGASPGASTAVSIMLQLLEKCFKEKFNSEAWQKKLREMIPSFGHCLATDEALCANIRNHTASMLGLNN